MSSDDNDLFVDHVNHSIGGLGGHAFRRLTHISMACIPYLYYVHGEDISSIFSLEMSCMFAALNLCLRMSSKC